MVWMNDMTLHLGNDATVRRQYVLLFSRHPVSHACILCRAFQVTGDEETRQTCYHHHRRRPQQRTLQGNYQFSTRRV